jgi:iron complex transport system ATP-binding protein
VTAAVRVDAATVEIGGRRLLDGVDVSVDRGGWLAIVGPNGAGKTTLLHAIAGLRALHSGRVELMGRDASGIRVRARAQLLALVPQIPVIPMGMTVLDYVLLGRTPHLSFFASETAADVTHARGVLERLEISELSTRQVETLSGGERQRLLLARALLQDTPIVLLDEPTTALDIGHQQDVLELVEELRHEQHLAVISTMHDLTLAGLYAEELVLLDRGRVQARGHACDVLTEERLHRHFGAQVSVIASTDGPIVVPRRPTRSKT